MQGWYAIFPGCGARGDISVTSVKDKPQHKLCLYMDICFCLFLFCFVLLCFVFCFVFLFVSYCLYVCFFVCLFVCLFFFFTFSAVYASVHPHRVQEMLKYAQVVRTAAARHKGWGWRSYDI